MPRSLDVLAERAQTIVRGRVVSMKLEPHPQFQNLQTVVVNMQVDSVLKGQAGKTFTFRQFVWDVRDRYNNAGYKKGEEVLLLLNPVSDYGLTSPAGMEQGRFVIHRDAKGNVTAVNGFNNSGLFKGVAQAASQKGITFSARTKAMVQGPESGAVQLSDLEDAIRTLAKSTGVAK